jgi:predicted AAA+ superfamily ATPase
VKVKGTKQQSLQSRYLHDQIVKDLGRKMVFVAGPRQCGKTTLARQLVKMLDGAYLNWDVPDDRELILKRRFETGKDLIAFDEIHKYRRWRDLLKGIYDKRGKPHGDLGILVTGSAKLDFYRRGGDSLQGRYHLLRMHPLSVAELGGDSSEALAGLLRWGGFPEPYFSRSDREARRWSREYRGRLVREELLSLEKVSEVSLIEEMMVRLPDLVGSPLSLNNLREELGVAHATVARWLEILENVYAIFRLTPFGAPRIRAVKKERKHYHFDWTLIEEPGLRFENLMACHLLKWCDWIEDTEGHSMELRYFKDNEKREVDFVVVKDRRPVLLVEAKLQDQNVSPALRYLKRKFPQARAVQVLAEKDIDFTNDEDIRICHAGRFLSGLV